jgi:hypothetical protein
MRQPDTVRRLLALRPGETLTYYRGDFACDIARSTTAPAYCGDTGAAPKYAALLKYIYDTALDLQRRRRVRLSQKYIELSPCHNSPSIVTEYKATGLEARGVE